MEITNPSLATPLKTGIIVGIIYCALIYCQNQFFYANPIEFILAKLLCYLIIVSGFIYTGYRARKESGGYISFKECLKAILVVIVITELFYVAFSTVYIKYIEPGFFDKTKLAWKAYFIANKVPQASINDTIEQFNERGKITITSIIQSYGFSIIIDAIFGVITAAIFKKSRPVFENQI